MYVNYCCSDITKEIVVNEAPFDEQLYVFNAYLIQLARYVDNMHNVIIPQASARLAFPQGRTVLN